MVTKRNWHSKGWKKALMDLKSSPGGLSEEEVRKRLRHFGPNRLPEERPPSKIQLLLTQFTSPLIYILLAAGLITLLLREFADAIIILGAVGLNVIVGYFQENKASQALRELKKILKIKAIAIRSGGKKEIPQEELVPGDIFVLRPGDKVPADGRLIEARDLKTNEASLTGEWLPAAKSTDILPEGTPLADRDNMIYMSTIVEDGWGKAIVTETGIKTEIGKVARLLSEMEEEETPYQRKLAHFSKIIGIVITAICAAIFITGVLEGNEITEMFITAVAVAVAGIPEGLPVAMTVILALGMQRILKRKGLVRRLASAETLGSTSIICTDKTGTLTEAKMRVAGIYTAGKEILRNGKHHLKRFDGEDKQPQALALRTATLCSEAFIENPNEPLEQWVVRGRPTEKALLIAGVQAGISRKDLEKEQPKIAILSFDPTYKYSAGLHKLSEEKDILYATGAPELLLQMSSHIALPNGKQDKITTQRLRELNQKNRDLTGMGLRVVGTAYKKIKRGSLTPDKSGGLRIETVEKVAQEMVFVGFIALHDPLRPEAKDAIKTCQAAGMRPIIVTGDHKLTAKAVAEGLGLRVKDKNIIEGKELEKLSDKEFERRLADLEIYARVEPRQKLRIVEAWQKRGEVVAMTGDGINDAPALKRADIGVALGSGTEVAKEVSDLILLTDNFSILVAAVEEGRAIVDNVRKVITYLLSDSFSEIILVGASVLARVPLPISAAQILWTNLVEDGLPDIALAFEPKEKDLMKRKPEGHGAPLLNREMRALIFITGLVDDFFLLGLFFWLLRQGLDLTYIRTMIFVGLSIDTFYVALCCKSLRRNLWHINLLSNKFLVVGIVIGILMTVAAVYIPLFQTLLKTVPLGIHDWAILLGMALIELLLIEAMKWHFIVRHET